MRHLLAAALSLAASPALAICTEIGDDTARLACWDDAAQKSCEITDWSAMNTPIGKVKMTGASTCEAGEIVIRLYDGDRFVGADNNLIKGHAFTAFIDGEVTEPRPLFSISD